MNKENYQNNVLKNIAVICGTGPPKRLSVRCSVSPNPISLTQSKSYNIPPNVCRIVAALPNKEPLFSSATHVYMSPLKKRPKKPTMQYGRLWSPDYRVKTEVKGAEKDWESPP